MKKLLALMMVLLLVCAACGEPRVQLADEFEGKFAVDPEWPQYISLKQESAEFFYTNDEKADYIYGTIDKLGDGRFVLKPADERGAAVLPEQEVCYADFAVELLVDGELLHFAKVSDEPTLSCSEAMYAGYPQAEEIWVPCVAEVDGYRFELSKMENSDGTFTYEYVNPNFGSGERDTDVAKARALLKAVVGLEDVNLDLYTDESLLNSLNAERTRGTMKEFRYEVE